MKLRSGLWVVCLAALAPPALAETPPVVFNHQVINLDSGLHANNTGQESVPFAQAVTLPDTQYVRVAVGDYHLGSGSYIILRSLGDLDQQRLDARSLPLWKNRSAIFNGDGVIVELHVAPGDSGVFVTVTQAIGGRYEPSELPSPRSQCGATDDRVATTDNRTGRLYFGGCTGYRIVIGPRAGTTTDEETCLTAGHCVDFDPDNGGPGLPDGVLDLSGVMEFNVPNSTGGGTPIAAPANDQYPVVTAGVRWNFEGEGQGLGKDYAVFGVGRNANTDLLPFQAYGFPFRLTREGPALAATIRITGYGADTGAANRTCQTHTGPYLTENVNGANIWHEYQVDTEGANSGSPIIWNAQNLAIGIHTNAGCDIPNGNGNSGTSFEHSPLETDLRNYVSSLARFVDAGHPLRVAEEGTVYRPYSTVTLGAGGVSSGGILSIVTGSYNTAADRALTAGTGNKAMTLVAPVGSVTIGAP